MSKFTTEVRDICEYFSGLQNDVGYYRVSEIIDKSRDKIFNFEYPIFDEKYKKTLETKILKHYYTREIGFETMGAWLLKLETKLNEVMPYYNKLYESELIEFNPLHDVNVTRKHEGKEKDIKSSVDTGVIDSSKSNNSNTKQNNQTLLSENNVNTDLYSDTPQGALTGVESGKYLTNARKITEQNSRDTSNVYDSNTVNSSKDKSSSRNTNDETINSTEEYIESVIGKQGTGSQSQMLMKYRETFLNIDMMVIDELSDLFMLLW